VALALTCSEATLLRLRMGKEAQLHTHVFGRSTNEYCSTK
jgi:hypothetical protein